MGNIFNADFRDFIIALNKNTVEYIIVDGYAVILHGYSRTTGDLDIWVNPNSDNYLKLTKAFNEFGLPLSDMTLNNFLNAKDYDVFTFGRSPVSLDIMTAVKGLDFDESFKQAKEFKIDGLHVNLIGYRDLIAAKKASGRHKDLDDLEKLSKINPH